MASSNSLIMFLSSCFLVVFVVVAKQEFPGKTSEEEAHHYDTIQLSSLFPSSVCNPSIKGTNKIGSIDVVHKYGPCSKLNEDKVKLLTTEEILKHEQSRVDSIRARSIVNRGGKDILGEKVTLPTQSSPGNYLVTVGLGSPEKDLSLFFDTGSDLTWTQCQPCAGSCYSQKEPIFSPSESTTYSNISCTSTECSGLASSTGHPGDCISSTCVYRVMYGDRSFTEGFLGKEKLTLTSNDIIDNFYFGCGQNQGHFSGAAGLLGLGRGKLSIVSQAESKYGKVFSYCLPSQSSSIGYLTFGSSGAGGDVKYTPILNAQGSSFYDLDLEGITVGGTKLAISPTIFKTSGMIIDSGTVITRLPPTAYSALRDAFKAGMTNYPLTQGPSLFDTCYDFSNSTTVTIPQISMLWGGDTIVNIAPEGSLYAIGPSQACLAFAANDDDSVLGIFGNSQQKTLQVVYDVNAGKVGFASGGCA